MIGLVSNLSPGAARIRLVGYNQVMAWHLARELDAILVPDALETADLSQLPEVDDLIVIGSRGIRSLRARGEDVEQIPCRRLFWLSDGPVRSIIPWGKTSICHGSYVGMGADPEVCRPGQGQPTVAINAWNATVDQGLTDDPSLIAQFRAAEALDKAGILVLGMNVKSPHMEPVGRDTGDPLRLRYVPWVDVVEAYRRSWVFLDATPKVIELGRVEAAACGAALLVPPHGAEDIDGIRYLPQAPWTDEPLEDQARRIIDNTRTEDFQARADRVQEYFAWPKVAKRITNYLERT